MSQLFKNWLFKNKNQSYQQTFWFLPKGLLIVFIIYSVTSKAQFNLVPNPSFEVNIGCPSSSGQLPYAIPWTAPTNDEAEYFNTCSTNPYYSVPNQIYNFQYAHTGDGFIGIFVYNGTGLNYREYAQAELVDTLNSLSCYYVEFYVNRASGSAGGKYATNNISCSFTNTAINNTGTGYLLNLSSDIVKFSNPIIVDTLSWVKISGIFTSNGGEKFITIGNFSSDDNTDTLNTFDDNYPGAYYFIDDVSVIPIDSILGGMPAFAGNDTSITIGDSVFVGQEIYNLNCNWYDATGTLIADSISGIFVSPTASTYYVVEQNLCGTITYDTVNVIVNPVGINETEMEKLSCKVFPNPNRGEFNVELNTNENNLFKLNVMDMQYRILYSEQIYSNSFKLNLDLESGAYLLHITNVKTNETVVQKLVIQK